MIPKEELQKFSHIAIYMSYNKDDSQKWYKLDRKQSYFSFPEFYRYSEDTVSIFDLSIQMIDYKIFSVNPVFKSK